MVSEKFTWRRAGSEQAAVPDAPAVPTGDQSRVLDAQAKQESVPADRRPDVEFPKLKVDRAAFEEIAGKLERGESYLTLEDVGNIFGSPFWILLVYALLDAREGARFLSFLGSRAQQAPEQQANSRIVLPRNN